MQRKCEDLALTNNKLTSDLTQAQHSKHLVAADKTREANAAKAALAVSQVRLSILLPVSVCGAHA